MDAGDPVVAVLDLLKHWVGDAFRVITSYLANDPLIKRGYWQKKTLPKLQPTYRTRRGRPMCRKPRAYKAEDRYSPESVQLTVDLYSLLHQLRFGTDWRYTRSARPPSNRIAVCWKSRRGRTYLKILYEDVTIDSDWGHSWYCECAHVIDVHKLKLRTTRSNEQDIPAHTISQDLIKRLLGFIQA